MANLPLSVTRLLPCVKYYRLRICDTSVSFDEMLQTELENDCGAFYRRQNARRLEIDFGDPF